jgi:hypothetical protein
MSAPAPPLRFLTVVVGGWVCARAAVLAPDWLTEEVKASEPPLPRARLLPLPAIAPAPKAANTPLLAPSVATVALAVGRIAPEEPSATPAPALALSFTSGQLAVVPAAPAPEFEKAAVMDVTPSATVEAPFEQPQPIAAALAQQSPALAVSGWGIVREGGGSDLATGGVLGGSQIGARATYRVTQSLALSGRVSAPLKGDGAELGVGIEWQPVAGVPVKLLAERRQAIGDEGRSAFAVLAHGGVSGVKVAGAVTADAYVQAGVVGARERDMFVDGAAKVSLPVSNEVSVGAGAWGAAQPGVSRLDVGPHVTLTLPGAKVKVSAEFRVRIAGDAEPGTGPAITLATDF